MLEIIGLIVAIVSAITSIAAMLVSIFATKKQILDCWFHDVLRRPRMTIHAGQVGHGCYVVTIRNCSRLTLRNVSWQPIWTTREGVQQIWFVGELMLGPKEPVDIRPNQVIEYHYNCIIDQKDPSIKSSYLEIFANGFRTLDGIYASADDDVTSMVPMNELEQFKSQLADNCEMYSRY